MRIAVIGCGDDDKLKAAIKASLEDKGHNCIIIDTLPADYVEPFKYEAPPEIPELVVRDFFIPNQPSARAARRKAERDAKKKKRRF